MKEVIMTGQRKSIRTYDVVVRDIPET
jgi:hypothetical protein